MVVPLVVGAAVVAMIVIGIGFAAARLYDEPDYGCITDSPCDPEYEYPGAD